MDKTLIALFPDIKTNGSHCQAFEHIGQHGGADYHRVISLTIPVGDTGQDKIDKDELIKELKERGYHLKEVKRDAA